MSKVDRILEKYPSNSNSESKYKQSSGQTVIEVVQINSRKETPKGIPLISAQLSKKNTPPMSKNPSTLKKSLGEDKEVNKNKNEGEKEYLTLKNYTQIKTASRLERVKSSTKMERESLVSQERKMRLRQYLFTAQQSLQKNRQKRSHLKRTSPPGSQLQAQASIHELRMNKYKISNEQMHVIVKKGVETKLRQLITSLQSDLTYIESQDVEKVTKEDLDYFYEMRQIVNRRIEPAVNEMQNANSKRQQNLLQGILCLGNNLVQRKDTFIDGNIPLTNTVSKGPQLIQSLFMKRQ